MNWEKKKKGHLNRHLLCLVLDVSHLLHYRVKSAPQWDLCDQKHNSWWRMSRFPKSRHPPTERGCGLGMHTAELGWGESVLQRLLNHVPWQDRTPPTELSKTRRSQLLHPRFSSWIQPPRHVTYTLRKLQQERRLAQLPPQQMCSDPFLKLEIISSN